MNVVGLSGVLDFLKSNENKNLLFTFHSIGDRDAVGSAIALSSYFKHVEVGAPDFITTNARRMLKEVGYEKEIKVASLEGIDTVVVFDANNLDALGSLKEGLLAFGGDILFIDHHLLGSEQLGRNFIFFSDESYNSTSSIVYDIILKAGKSVNKMNAILLLNGIISDSADFKNATAYTFTQIGELLKVADISYAGIMEYFHESIPLENRLSTIRDLYASKIELIDKYILIYGEAKMHANIAADMALHIGADASLFWMVSSKEATISVRLRSPLDKKLSLHLGKVMEHVSGILNGNGGGHPCAAGAYGHAKENIQEAVNKALAEIKNALSRK
ncbi:MAG: DHH family phosphoesterase [Candidatus Micrarchaeia archaeon]